MLEDTIITHHVLSDSVVSRYPPVVIKNHGVSS